MKLATLLNHVVPMLVIPLGFATAAETEKIRNSHAIVTEDVLAPGDSRTVRGDLPSVTVYCQAGSVNSAAVKQGDVAFLPTGARTLKNTGTSPMRLVRVEFPGQGSAETWGLTGIPHYKLLMENRYARVYNIRVAAGAVEPQHTHKDRVVVCLSGAELVHTMPDGREEPATLKSGEIDWRLGATHVGHNIGKTDLWVVAVEPK